MARERTPGRESERQTSEGRRLLVASNRLPVRLVRGSSGRWTRKPGSGGLVSALEPVLRSRGGTWVGWPGVLEGEVPDLRSALEEGEDPGYRLVPVSLTASERRDFYRGFSNEILWPLCHGLPSRCNFKPRYWRVYRRVNRKFAEAIGEVAGLEDLLWIHDYHLMAAAEELRAAGRANLMGFFLHIPFPPPDLFEHLPWADEVMGSLLHYDVVGLQTNRDRENLLACARVLPGVEAVVERDDSVVLRDGRCTRVAVHPISIDNEVFAGGALRREIEMESDALRSEIGTERILLGVDRLDYTKGIPEKLLGLERALERHPDLLGRITLVQLVVPSREMIPEYERMKERVERLVGHINGRFTDRGWAPILYRFGTWDRERLLAFYRAADAALVTPLRDGMNLVSKEFCAASVDGRGVLVLSCFAGSAAELEDGAILVNPHDVDAVADAIWRACTMGETEARERLSAMRARLRENDVHRWVRDFLASAEEAGGAKKGGAPPVGPRMRRPA